MLSVVLDADAREQAARCIAWLSAPAPDPFAQDTLVVPTLGLGLWLEQCLAAQVGVSANLKIELPARFLWQQLAARVPGTPARAPFDAAITRWAIFDALGQLPAGDAFSLLRERWQQAGDADRVLLAVRLARLYEQYQAYRRDWLTRWSQDQPVRFDAPGDAQTEVWQRWLWRQILLRVRGLADRHPFDALRAQSAARAGPLGTGAAGGRIVLFGLFSLSPEQLEMLALLGDECEMLWLAPDPAQGFWEDLVSPATAARLSAQAPEAGWLYPGEPAVLGEWGRQQRDFLVQLRRLETAGLLRIGDDDLRGRETAAPSSRLSALQQSVFLLSDSPWDALALEHDFARDGSLEVHATHSLVRQVEVAHDRLLDAFAQLPDLRADQVAILCADLESAAGLVRAVFELDGATSLPVAVSGRSGRDDPAVRALLEFVALVEGRAGLSAVLAWFDNDWLRERLRIDTDALAAVAEALQAAGVWRDDLAVRDGWDPTGDGDSAPVDAAMPKHGWRRGIERLLLGLLVDPQAGGGNESALQGVVADCWPMPALDRDQCQVLEKLLLLVDEVRRWRQDASASTERPVVDWAGALLDWADRWLGGADGQREGPYRIREAIAQLTGAFEALDAPQSKTLGFAAFAEGLRQVLAESDPAARSQGAITVAPLGSLTGIAYRVVVLLGLDEGSWPPRQALAEFDLMRAHPRQGDRRGADVARGVFLQTLLDTTDRVVICHTGRDSRDDGERQPARVVVELLDALQTQAKRCGCAEIAKVQFGHPLQAFSPRRFLGSLPSHARVWHAAARYLVDPARMPVRQGPVACAVIGARPMPSQMRLAQLAEGLARPQRAYLQRHVQMQIPWQEKAADAHEPLEPADIDRWWVSDMQEAIEEAAGQDRDDAWLQTRLQAHPAIPQGRIAAAPAAWAIRQWQEGRRRREQVCRDLGLSVEPLHAARFVQVDLPLPDGQLLRLSGPLGPIHADGSGGQVLLGPTRERFRMSDYVLAWLQYLAGLVLQADAQRWSVLLPSAGGTGKQASWLGFGPVLEQDESRTPTAIRDAASARAELLRLVGQWQLIERSPPRVYGATALAWLQASQGDTTVERHSPAWGKALLAWQGGQYGGGPGDVNDRWSKALWRDDPPDLKQVLQDSLSLYAPIWLSAQGAVGDEEQARDDG